MKITKDFPGLVDELWCFRFIGSIETEESLEIDLGSKWLIVSGSVKAGEGIKAGMGIKAGEGIKAGWGIKAGLSIRCHGELKFAFHLFAGIASWKKADGDDLLVEAKRIDGDVKHGTVRLLQE